MKKIFAYTLIALSLLTWSCQKEINWGINTGSTNSGLLIKTVKKSGTDSTVTRYAYDASGRLADEKLNIVTGGTAFDNDFKIYRNGSGVVTRTVQTSSQLTAGGIDSVVAIYYFDASLKRYTSSVSAITLMGSTVSDSTTYTYDASGKIIYDELYQSVIGLPYTLTSRTNYEYSTPANSVIVMKQSLYDAVGGTFDLFSELDCTYDTKINPLHLDAYYEGIVLLRPSLYSPNNAVQTNYIDPNDATNNRGVQLNMTYNTNNTPKSAISTETPGPVVSTFTYYYQ